MIRNKQSEGEKLKVGNCFIRLGLELVYYEREVPKYLEYEGCYI